MSKGLIPGGRVKTVLSFLTEALGRFEVWSKWSMSKELLFCVLVRCERFPGFCTRVGSLLGSFNKFPKEAPELQTLNSISTTIIIISKYLLPFYSRVSYFSFALPP